MASGDEGDAWDRYWGPGGHGANAQRNFSLDGPRGAARTPPAGNGSRRSVHASGPGSVTRRNHFFLVPWSITFEITINSKANNDVADDFFVN